MYTARGAPRASLQYREMNMVDNRMAALLKRGFSKRMAREYQDILLREDANDLFDPAYRSWAHSHGFFAESACAFGLNEDNVDQYLPDYEYFRVWPLNSWQRVWINDKLTLKYMLTGTEYDKYLPKYYFYTGQQGLMPLSDCGARGTIDGFLGTLREVGEFACKPANGERAQGFNKLSYVDGTYLIDNVEAGEADVRRFVEEHPNNVFTEFFHAGRGMEKVSPVIHTVRVQTVNPTGADPVLACSYLRFATGAGKDGKDDSVANYRPPETAGVGSFNARFDLETGKFGDCRIVYGNKVEMTDIHPDTGASGTGQFADWAEARSMVEGLADRFNLVEYMGFDICETPDGPKLIEINSHSGGKYLQVFTPFLKDAYLGDYFRGKLAAIDALSAGDIVRRNETVR